MLQSRRGISKLVVGLAVACTIAGAGNLGAQTTGPSTSAEPYLLPNATLEPGTVETISILTVGDVIDGYTMVGIPDGMGAWHAGDDDEDTFDLAVNHELRFDRGIVRAHGSIGAFVSRWTIDSDDLSVTEGQDHAQSADDVYTWDRTAGEFVAGTTVWQRFCSGDLPSKDALKSSGVGTTARIYLCGEETNAGRAFAHVVSGQFNGESWELPRLGKLAWENVVACPHRQKKTIVACLDDADLSTSPVAPNVPSEVFFYVGTKTKTGHPIERAGLTNGTLWGMQVTIDVDGVDEIVTEESNAFGLGGSIGEYAGTGRFKLIELGDYSAEGESDATLQADAIANDIFRMQRVEDGAWDPRDSHKDEFYFLTTASTSLNSRLWRLDFDDIGNPQDGGTIEILLAGDEGHLMLDNMCVDANGRVLLQEDVGNNDRLGKVWIYDIATAQFVEVAAHNPDFFEPPAATHPEFLTRDEESSGIIDAKKFLGNGWYLLDVQAHYATTTELVEGGQLLAMYVAPDLFDEGAGDEDDGD
ncbi:MAG: phytase [Planctomycetes bacterium]|nr:phytase [Planctomycetota bacterium]